MAVARHLYFCFTLVKEGGGGGHWMTVNLHIYTLTYSEILILFSFKFLSNSSPFLLDV
jgi:hypothetical protein